MAIEHITSRLQKVKQTGKKQYQACCPAHQDSDPSLSLRELEDGRVLIHCFGGCSPVAVMESIGLTLSDLFEEPLADRIRPLYMATQEKKRLAKRVDEVEGCKLRLRIAQDMRSQGIKLSKKELTEETQAFIRLRQLTEEQSGAA